jgi:hypothetical protein
MAGNCLGSDGRLRFRVPPRIRFNVEETVLLLEKGGVNVGADQARLEATSTAK